MAGRWQGRGIGRRLVLAAIERFGRLGGRELLLESSSKLGAALHLYQKLGFEHRGRKRDSHYARSDVYMVRRADVSLPGSVRFCEAL